jgi:hypothetical protein
MSIIVLGAIVLIVAVAALLIALVSAMVAHSAGRSVPAAGPQPGGSVGGIHRTSRHAGDNVQVAGGDGRSLEAVVSQNHEQVRTTLVEAARITATPGVYEELNGFVQHRLRGLLDVEQAVLGESISAHIGRPTADVLDRQRRELGRQLTVLAERPDRPVPAELRDRFEEHAAWLGRSLSTIGAVDAHAARNLVFVYMEQADLISHR